MSEITQPLNTGQQMTTNYDLSKIFLWDNRYDNEQFVNNTNYNPVTLKAGTVMGRVTATGILRPCDASQTDGSNIPIGILAQDLLVLGGATARCSICVRGDVNRNGIIFWTANTFDTITAGRRYYDLIQDVGIKIVAGQELSGYDNQ